MSRVRIVIKYIVDNSDWTEQEFEDNQDIERTFHITDDMLHELILQHTDLESGEFIDCINEISKN